ncbi:DUF6173 family protein [Pacificibacter marinus]|uniref:Uncharacterized protein n=1 Tax=Pacificibacter marinus TaxID=658057 RepID=A0A1Y5TGS3_9RHOB|nr:DUF6173 family protein [Pacificibacter marinus]SEL17993.1 hypothetical protein SAMN04488032_11364 [Pacificibacter marinus]SLN63535.1 hypothetical protein PAM7971_03300 [Pacificibacter marinus]
MNETDQIQTTAEAVEAAAMPHARVVHSDPNAPQSPEQKPLPAALCRKPVSQKGPAEWAYERLVLYIKNFEEQLDAEHEIAMGFTGSSTGALRIEGMGFFDPDIVTFYGSDDSGTKTQLIQHVSQLNVMLRALPKQAPEREAMRIGFKLVDELESNTET